MAANFNVSTFKNQFPGSSIGKDGTAIEFTSQDAQYRVYIPGVSGSQSSVSTDSAGNVTVKLQQDHNISGGKDDHATSTLVFDSTGNLTSIDHDMNLDDGGAYKIPKWVTSTLNIGVELLGALGALETAGVSEVAAQGVVAGITAVCDGFNKICGFVYKHADDGGRLNFPAVVCHNMNRVCASVTA